MSDHPIIFSAPMVQALLAGRKTQTRRLALTEDKRWPDGDVFRESSWMRVKPGDRLWVRETWKPVPVSAYRCSEGVQQTQNPNDADEAAVYGAGWDRSTGGTRWRPSIHMPRWASRCTLTVTQVRVQRLQEISEADAKAEGVAMTGKVYSEEADEFDGPWRSLFAELWNSLHGPDAWDANPEVVAISFTVEQRNIDARKRMEAGDE